MLSEIRETRRELARLNADLAKLGSEGANKGKTFGQRFKNAAMAGVKELGRGLMQGLGTGIGQGFGQVLGEKIANKLFSLGRKGGKSYGGAFKKAAKEEIDTVATGTGGLKLNLGALPVIGAGVLAAGIAAQVGTALSSAFEQERLQVSFNALSADGAGGSRIFSALRADALRTGQDIESMAGTVQRFLGLGFAEDDALQLQRSLLDIAGAIGMTTSEAALLGSALAQVKAKGVASMEELRQQIAEKGVPVFQVLAEKLGVTEAAIIDMVSSGKLGADVVIEAFQNMEGALARFKGGADRTGSSGGGLFARMKQEALDLKRIFGEQLIPELKPIFLDMIGFIQRMKEDAKGIGQNIAEGLGTVRAAFQSLSFRELLEMAALKFKEKLIEGFNFASRAASALMSTLADGSFETMMQRSALRFKEIMLEAASEVAMAMSAGASGRLKTALENASAFSAASADVAAAQREAIEADNAGRPSFGEAFKSAFDSAVSNLDLSPEEKSRMESLRQRFATQRAANVAAQSTASPPPAGAPTTTTSMAAPAMQPGGLIAGGLANAISRISGGGTLLMTRQLDLLREVKTATTKTAAAAEKTVAAVNSLPSRLGPLWT